MRSHIIALGLVILALLVAGGVAVAKSSEVPPTAKYSFAQTTMYGGNYQLNGGCSGFSIASESGDLLLMPLSAPRLADGCCCSYLPYMHR